MGDVQPDAPIPLSFPALLRNPGITNRYGQLKPERSHVAFTVRRLRRDENEGKRWLRRKDNSESLLLAS